MSTRTATGKLEEENDVNCFCVHAHWEATLPGAAGPALVAALLQATGLWPLVWGIIAACLVVAWIAMFDYRH